MVPMLAILLQTGDEAKYGPIVGMASGIMVLSLLVFAISVLRELFRRRA
jgi:Na+-transporting methylmalonyl-CoA/oxaloacetate decarboxylase gamma subunit